VPLLAYLWFNAVLCLAAVSDVRSFRIPNLLSVLLALGAVAVHAPADWAEALSRLGSLLMVSGLAGVLWLRGMLGGGDLKLLAACALWMPLPALGLFAFVLGWAGALQGIGALILMRRTLRAGPVAARHAHRMPYGLSIAAAGLIWSSLRLMA
jgi:prepilin peptidase CpaA